MIDFEPKTVKKNVTVVILLFLLSAVLASVLSVIYTSGVNVFAELYIDLIVLTLLIFTLFCTMYAYFYYQSASSVKTNRNTSIMISVVFITCIVAFVCMKYISVYVVPIEMTAVIIGLMISRTLGFIANITTSTILIVSVGILQYATGGSLLGFYEAVVGIVVATVQAFFMMYLIKKNYTRFKLMFGSIAVGALLSALSMIFAVSISFDWKYILMSYAYTFAGSVLAVAGFSAIIPLFEEVFDVWTNFKLAEACSMSRDLLKRLASEAPGTFNHCIIVSNVAESCALAIGENPYLAKACGIYHDIGKLTNPEFFVENQEGGYNPHDDLVPETSARMIISHCKAGYEMLRNARLPEEIALVAKEHHGTTLTKYFYDRASMVAGSHLDDSNFRYDGPKPSTKISAIVMIADGVEAITRAKSPSNSDELRALIDMIINSKIQENQFSECAISFADLDVIKETIVKVIPAVYHKRIDYDKAQQ